MINKKKKEMNCMERIDEIYKAESSAWNMIENNPPYVNALSNEKVSWDEDSWCDGFEKGAKWADEHPQSPWIKCSERMPKSGTEYLPFVDKWGYHYFGMFKNGSWYLYGYGKYDIRVDYDVVVAWMPISKFEDE